MGKVLRISLELNFTTNTLGCYGLITDIHHFDGSFKSNYKSVICVLGDVQLRNVQIFQIYW